MKNILKTLDQAQVVQGLDEDYYDRVIIVKTLSSPKLSILVLTRENKLCFLSLGLVKPF